jgi:hypothetical protein
LGMIGMQNTAAITIAIIIATERLMAISLRLHYGLNSFVYFNKTTIFDFSGQYS